MKKLRRILAIPFLALVLSTLVITQTATNRLTHPPRPALNELAREFLANPASHGMTVESRTSPDGTPFLLCRPDGTISSKGATLRKQLARRGMRGSGHGTILLLHGFGGRKEHFLPVAERFCAAGFQCLIPDLPGHGENPETRATFGRREIPMLVSLLDHVHATQGWEPDASIFGMSQGGAIAIQFAAAHPERTKCVASLSAFANLGETMENSARRQGPVYATLAGPLVPLVNLNARFQHGFAPARVSPETAARFIRCPVFLAHGLDDRLIPPANARRIFKNIAAEKKTLRLVPDASHGDVLLRGHEIYADLATFFVQNSR